MNKFSQIQKKIRRSFLLLYAQNVILAVILVWISVEFLDFKASSNTIMNVILVVTIASWDRSGDCKCSEKPSNKA